MLSKLPLDGNSDDFIFDAEFLAQAIYFGYRLGEISCPARYFAEASSLNFGRSAKYGLLVLWVVAKFWLQKKRLRRFRMLAPQHLTHPEDYYREVSATTLPEDSKQAPGVR